MGSPPPRNWFAKHSQRRWLSVPGILQGRPVGQGRVMLLAFQKSGAVASKGLNERQRCRADPQGLVFESLPQGGERPCIAWVRGQERAGGNQTDAQIGIRDEMPHDLANRVTIHWTFVRNLADSPDADLDLCAEPPTA